MIPAFSKDTSIAIAKNVTACCFFHYGNVNFAMGATMRLDARLVIVDATPYVGKIK